MGYAICKAVDLGSFRGIYKKTYFPRRLSIVYGRRPSAAAEKDKSGGGTPLLILPPKNLDGHYVVGWVFDISDFALRSISDAFC